jgi:hypothetical protein
VQSLILPGWTIGAGLEHLLAANWLVRLHGQLGRGLQILTVWLP